MDVAEMKPIQSGKAKAPVNVDVAKGAALATVCINYATKRMAEEEKQHGKLKMFIKNISELNHTAHVEFRAELTKELNLAKELQAGADVKTSHMGGYSLNSFKALVSNWKTISTACELGYKPEDKSWPVVVAESVQMREAHASNASEGAQLPIKRKAGRKATPLIEKAQAAAEKLSPEEFVQFAAWVETTLKHMPKTDAALV